MITNSWLRPFQNLHAPAQELHLKLAVFRGREKGCVRRQLNRGKRTAQGRSPFGLNAALRDELIPYDEAVYDAGINAEYWRRRPVTVIVRSFQIGWEFGRWFLLEKFSNGDARLSQRQAERLREVLTNLGPAFVKIGQAVSSRPDLLPPLLTRELEKLQDQIPPFSDQLAMHVLRRDLAADPALIFSQLSASPVAAASLGQVYRGRLREGDREVAVKVQRPGVREAIALDLFILRWAAAEVRTYRRLNSDLPALLDEWAASLFRELDYEHEAANGIRFAQLYSDLEGVFVPEMLLKYTTKRVLVMDWVDGRRLRSAGKGASAATRAEDLRLVDIGVRCSLEQMLEKGFYHSDPHPGNLFRTADGKLAYIDFGMMGEIQPSIRRGLINATLHLVNREFAQLAEDFMGLGLLPPDSDVQRLAPALTAVFSKALAGGVSNVSFSALSADLGQTMYQFNFRIPPYYTLLVRSLSVLEGIALSADPSYKVLGAAYPWIARRLLTDTSGDLYDTLRNLLYKDGRFQFQRMESLLLEATRFTFSPPLSPAPAPPPGRRALMLLLGPNGGFLRDVLIEEVAKGLDAGWRYGADQAVTSLTSLLQGEAVGGPLEQAPESVGRTLLAALSGLPRLASRDDQAQVEGLATLAATLEKLVGERAAAERAGSRGVSASWGEVAPLSGLLPPEATQAILTIQWFAREAAELPPSARLEALKLPALVAASLTSRLTARALRTLLLTAPPPWAGGLSASPRTAARNTSTSNPPPAESLQRGPAPQPTPSRPALATTASSQSVSSRTQAGRPAAAEAQGPVMVQVPGPPGNGVRQASPRDERVEYREPVPARGKEILLANGVVMRSSSNGSAESNGNGKGMQRWEETVMVALPPPPPSPPAKQLPEQATLPS